MRRPTTRSASHPAREALGGHCRMQVMNARLGLFGLTTVAMLAFGANSLLVRAALVGELIDPLSLTAIRIASGGLVLLPLALRHRVARKSERPPWSKRWRGALALLAYAALFSFAYVKLAAGTGALLLFGAVQVTMVAIAATRGERPSRLGIVGMMLASAGLVVLVLPGLSAPPWGAAALMLAGGVAWGVYSHLGRGAPSPAELTASNFVKASVLVVPVAIALGADAHMTRDGVLLAAASGALASGLGYVIWYRALAFHTATSAAAVQLSAPFIAAVGGIVLLGEPFTARLVVGAIFVLGGIGLSLTKRRAV